MVCTQCQTKNADDAKFCCQCGNDLTVHVDAPTSEELKNLADTLNEQAVSTKKQPLNLNQAIVGFPKKIGSAIAGAFRKIGKKRLILIASALVLVAVCVVVSVTYIIPYAPHYFDGNAAMKSGDYVTAISEYQGAGSFLNAKSKLNEAHYLFAEQLMQDERYYDAAQHYNVVTDYEDTQKKIIECGTKLLDNKAYTDALTVLEMINTDEVSEMKHYASGQKSFGSGAYAEAKKSFTSAGTFRDSQTMVYACDLMSAEGCCKDGNFSTAKSIYAGLPEDFTYNGISAASRLGLLNSSQALLDAMGKWTATSNYIETRNVYKRNGSWDSWYHDNVLSGQTLEISCTMNDTNTFDIKGKVVFYKFDDYSSLSEYCKAKSTTRSFSIYNVTSIPSSYQIDSYTTLNYSNGVFSIQYSERDNYSSYFYNLYNSSVTYGSKS